MTLPIDRNVHNLSHGTSYFSVEQIVLVNCVPIYVSHWPWASGQRLMSQTDFEQEMSLRRDEKSGKVGRRFSDFHF